ncbi:MULTISPECIES: hypothetical protein [Marichromatium]|uniref:Uncharacterized protein n=1 Tax=Marichromatium gracile TaxID=1048 RepID=A0A4V2W968_MARGR|nr:MULTISPECIES: hypothetical protein [Marichromatium]MBK1708414.1 hypothetical protein [Marichromatium gracile]MBO8086221.1 hypothetical protein [Marichromatium sp.]RNE89772.1 hypothetical protein EBL84_10205 [Marichromatium sp. AB31]TCW34210.1 hypothetical protein EDC29_11262 [Marichromatium gracile]
MAIRIETDQDLRAALDALTHRERRVLGCRFAERVGALCSDARVHQAIATGVDPASPPEALAEAFRIAKAHATRTYTDCGKDTDWMAQAEHFVAAAASAALAPEDVRRDARNPAWKAAVQARMAINCAMMEDDTQSESAEVEAQYALAREVQG